MILISKAFKIIKAKTFVLGTEYVDLASIVGRVLAENIIADTDLPPFDRSQMDGFAVIAKDTAKAPVELKIVGESSAGRGWHHKLKSGEAVRIMTGAPVPKGADAVQKVELTSEGGVQSAPGWDSGTDDLITILEPTEKGRFIIRKGLEVRKGAQIFSKGEVVKTNMIAALAAFGYSKVKVAQRPKIAIMGTGSEIVEIDQQPAQDQIRNSNSLMLKALAEKHGAAATIFPIAKDRISDLKKSISAAAKKNDIVVITGGVSVGKYDFTKPALLELGAEIFFDKIALKPGKPTVFAKLGNTYFFGLPGNPVSAAVTFHLFVRQMIMQMQNSADIGLRHGFAVLNERAKGTKDRDTYLPSKLDTDKTGRLIAQPLKWHGSSDFIGFARAEALIILPKGSSREKGEISEIVHL